jgi:nucleoside-diphosphate-sugar epimerase
MTKRLSVVVTGAHGFVGSALCEHLLLNDHIALTTLSRRQSGFQQAHHVQTDLSADTDLSAVLNCKDVVIHTAARVHMMQDNAADPLAEFRLMNTQVTLNLARQAATQGVRRFIFLSSIKVMGEANIGGKPFRADQAACPSDPYAQSKYEAEQGLLQISRDSGMEVVIIRPPLIYGQGVKANFQKLIRLMQKQIPLPFKAVNNSRSLLALPNLISLIERCIDHPAAANQIFLASDNHDLSTADLMAMIARAGGKKAWLLPFPPALLHGIGRLLGKKAAIDRLCGDLRIDISPTMELLQWQPPFKPQVVINQAVIAELSK